MKGSGQESADQSPFLVDGDLEAERSQTGTPPTLAPATENDADSDGASSDGAEGEMEDPYERARTICLNQLSYSARTRAHLESVLLKRKIPADVATEVLDRFAELGLINDAEFARAYAQGRQRSKGLSLRAIERELRDKGVEPSDVDVALAEIDVATEHTTALALVQRKLRQLSGLDPQIQTRRLVGMLARKGYSPSLAFTVVREALADAATDAVPDMPPDD